MWNRAIALMILLLVAPTIRAADGVELPTEVTPFVPAGTTAIDLEQGSITGEGHNDYLLVVEKNNGDRKLILLVREHGILRAAASNDTVIGCDMCLGMGGDYEISATGDGFEIDDTSGAGGISETVIFRFAYVADRKTWVLLDVKKVENNIQTQPETHTTSVVKPTENGKAMSFRTFDGSRFVASKP